MFNNICPLAKHSYTSEARAERQGARVTLAHQRSASGALGCKRNPRTLVKRKRSARVQARRSYTSEARAKRKGASDALVYQRNANRTQGCQRSAPILAECERNERMPEMSTERKAKSQYTNRVRTEDLTYSEILANERSAIEALRTQRYPREQVECDKITRRKAKRAHIS